MSARLDLDLFGLGGLDLQRFVDQVAQHLLAQALDLVGRDLAAVGDGQQREPLVDVGLGDDLAVDDRGRLDDRRHGRAEQLRIFGQPQRRGACSARLLRWAGCLLRDAPCRRPPSASAAAPQRARVEICSEPAATSSNPLSTNALKSIAVYPSPLNAGLAAEPFQREIEARKCCPCGSPRCAHSRAATIGQAPGIRPHRRCRAGGGPARSRRPATAGPRRSPVRSSTVAPNSDQ